MKIQNQVDSAKYTCDVKWEGFLERKDWISLNHPAEFYYTENISPWKHSKGYSLPDNVAYPNTTVIYHFTTQSVAIEFKLTFC